MEEQSIRRFSAHKFTSETNLPFSADKYSKFKFGCKDSAREFGVELAEKFISSLQFRIIILELNLNTRRVIILSSPYEHVPTATFALKNYFVRTLNAALVDKGLDPVLEAKIYRKTSYKEDYGDMSKEDRFNLMKNDAFYVDANMLKDNICIFMDDIIITGAHEHHILKMLEQHNLHKSPYNYFLYFAELTNPLTNPKIENFLNYYFVKDLICLDKIIKNDPFLLNTRVIKYILISKHEDCRAFLNYQKPVFLHTLYHEAIGNGYHKIEDYQKNLFYLKTLISEN